MTHRVLIDASNLNVGGGVQVAASVVDEISQFRNCAETKLRFPWLDSVVIEVSEIVARNLSQPVATVKVVDGSPRSRFLRPARSDEFDCVFTVFGPDYGWRRATSHIVGFADGLALHPEYFSARGLSKVRFHVRRWISRMSFRSSDIIIVESVRLARDLVRQWAIPAETVRVVPNVVNSAFAISVQQHEHRHAQVNQFVFGYATRAYPHKNLSVLGAAAEILETVTGIVPTFLLTLSDAEWDSLDLRVRHYSENVGPLHVGQLAHFYASVNAVIFPSLLESFSITPLEAALAGKALFASDRDFVRDILGDHATYFNPLDPADVAEAMRQLVSEPDTIRQKTSQALKVARDWPTAKDRTLAYLQIIDEALSQ